MFNAAQFRVFLRRAHQPESLTSPKRWPSTDVIEHDESNKANSEEILLSALDGLPDDKLTGFALRLALTTHTAQIPREGEIDLLAEAEAAFAPPQPKKVSKPKKAKTTLAKVSPKKNAAKKSVAA